MANLELLTIPGVVAGLGDVSGGFPSEDVVCFGGVGDAFGDVAGAAAGDLIRNGHVSGLLNRSDQFENADALTLTEVVDVVTVLLVEVLDGSDVAFDEDF